MLKMRVIVACIFTSLVLSGCSDENSSPDANKTNQDKKAENPIKSSLKRSASVAGVSPQSPDKTGQHAPIPPTRSELRVLSEQAKATEDEIKNVIEQFDANLANREARKEAEATFKKMLPEYKEKMLQIGKAKLKEQN